MSRLAVCLLGSFQVYWNDELLPGMPTDKTRALLAYLGLESKNAHQREVLAELFWPMRPQSAALNNLRQTLYLLRSTIHDHDIEPPYLLITNNEIQLNKNSDFWLDAIQFETALMACFSHHPNELLLCDTCLQRISTAIELYRGDFLAGLSLPDCPEFDWWLLARQETYHRLALEAFDRLARHFEQTRDYLRVSQYAQKAIELEPWHESSHRIKMRALANTGNPQEALHQFEVCQHILNQELGVNPSLKTSRLYQKIYARATGTTVNQAQPNHPPVTGIKPTSQVHIRNSLKCVGREKELGRLNTYLEQILAGNGRVALVCGEAGSGKSTLVSEFTHQILPTHPNLLVAVGSCHAFSGTGDPYTPFVQILRRLNGAADFEQQAVFQHTECDERLIKAHPNFTSALSSFGTEWAEYLSQGESTGGQNPAHGLEKLQNQKTRPRSQNHAVDLRSSIANFRPGQIALYDQYVQTIRFLAQQYPLVLVIEDLQWADSDSLGLLFHLSRNLTGRRILIIGTYRPEDLLAAHLGPDKAVFKNPSLRPILKEFQLMFDEIEVDLAQANGREFIQALLDSNPNQLTEEFRDTLYRCTEGHALFTVELLSSLQERGEIFLNPEGYWTAEPDLNWDIIPAKVEAIIADRLARLMPTQREMLRIASIQGELFCPEILARISGTSPISTQRNLSELVSVQRVINAEGLCWHGEKIISSYRFCHLLYQKYLYQTIDLVERKRLHTATAKELEALYAGSGSQDNRDLLKLAWHYEEGGRAKQASQYLQRAGRQAYLEGNNAEAIALFKRALALLRSLPATPERDAHEISLQLALSAPLRSERGYADQDAGRAYARVCELAQKLGDTNYYLLASFLLHSYYTSRADYKQAIELGMHLDHLSKTISEAAYRFQANFTLGVTHLLLGKFAFAKEQLSLASTAIPAENSIQLISPIGRDIGLLSSTFLSWLYWIHGETQKAQRTSQFVLQQALAHEHPYSQAFTLAISGCILNLLNQNYRAVQSQAAELRELSERSSFAMLQALAMIFLGRVRVAYGEFECGLHEMQAGLLCYQSTGHRMLRSLLLGLLADAYLVSSEPEHGLEIISLAEHIQLECGERFYEAELCRVKAALFLALAESQPNQNNTPLFQKAENSLKRSVQIARWQGARTFELRATLDYSKYLLELGQVVGAYSTLERVYSRFRNEVDLPEMVEAGRLLSELVPFTPNNVPLAG